MTEMTDDLSTPLGQKTERRKRRFRLPFTAVQALAVLFGLFLVVFLAVALFTDNPFGGEPVARIALRNSGDEKLPASASGKPEQVVKSASQSTGDNKTVTIIDGSSGKRQDVVIGGEAAGSAGAEPAAATAMTGIDQRRDFRAALRADSRLDAISDAELDELLDVRASLGACAAFVDRVRGACAGTPG